MSRFITLPGVNPPAARPKVDVIDPILPESGALFLVETAHPYEAWPTGVPSDNTALPNLALDQALALLESSTDAHAQLVWRTGAAIVDETRGMIERTGKGGIHTIFDDGLAGTATSNQEAKSSADMPSQMLAYLQAHSADALYISHWYGNTRVIDAAATVYDDTSHVYSTSGSGGATSSLLYRLGTDAVGVSGTALGGRNPQNVVGNQFTNSAQNGRTGDGVFNHGYAFITGNHATINGYAAGNAYNKHASRRFYRFYLENLTESGRTYAEVDAIDYALWQDAFSEGGRYYGDSYTDPATWVPA